MKIRLNAQDRLVGYFEAIPYNPMPDVVTWGTRVFQMRKTAVLLGYDDVIERALARIALVPVEPPPQDDCQLIYDECFAVAIVTPRLDS